MRMPSGLVRRRPRRCRDMAQYEYMALAEKTSVLREAMFLFEPRRVVYPAEYADVF